MGEGAARRPRVGGIHVDLDVGRAARGQLATWPMSLGATVLDEVLDGDRALESGRLPVAGRLRVLPHLLWPPQATARGRRGWDSRALLDQVCLDIPGDRYAGEVEFWSGLTRMDCFAGRWTRRRFERLALAALACRRGSSCNGFGTSRPGRVRGPRGPGVCRCPGGQVRPAPRAGPDAERWGREDAGSLIARPDGRTSTACTGRDPLTGVEPLRTEPSTGSTAVPWARVHRSPIAKAVHSPTPSRGNGGHMVGNPQTDQDTGGTAARRRRPAFGQLTRRVARRPARSPGARGAATAVPRTGWASGLTHFSGRAGAGLDEAARRVDGPRRRWSRPRGPRVVRVVAGGLG